MSDLSENFTRCSCCTKDWNWLGFWSLIDKLMGDFEHKEIFWGPISANFFILCPICLKISQDAHITHKNWNRLRILSLIDNLMGDFERKEIFWGPINGIFFILNPTCMKFKKICSHYTKDWNWLGFRREDRWRSFIQSSPRMINWMIIREFCKLLDAYNSVNWHKVTQS